MWSTFLISACAPLANYIPQGPSLSAEERQHFGETEPFSTQRASDSSDLPVFPFFVFGLAYKRDIVIESTDPAADMIEIAELAVPGSPNAPTLWIAKVSDQSGHQSLYSNRPEILDWMPEVNAPRFFQPEDAVFSLSMSNELHARIRLPDQRLLEVKAHLPNAIPEVSKKNSSTFNHSQDIASAVLEVSHRKTGLNATIAIDGHTVPAKRIFGFFPIKAILSQTQGGVLTAETLINAKENTLTVEVPTHWAVPRNRQCDRFEHHVVCREALTESTYAFKNGGFHGAEVHSFQGEHLFGLWLDSPLPPLHSQLSGTHRRVFAVDVGQMAGAGTGEIQICRLGDVLQVDLRPTSPTWFALRPMRTHIEFQNPSSWTLRSTRVDVHKSDSCPP